jgi:hypothetical protein
MSSNESYHKEEDVGNVELESGHFGYVFFFFFFFKILFLLKELYFSMLYFEPFLRFLSKKMKVHAL